MNKLKELKLIKPKRFSDQRGFFEEIYSRDFYNSLGIEVDFVQDNHSLSFKTATIRGLHFQLPPAAQAKLVRCNSGAIFDLAVDIRRRSPTYGQWAGYNLTAENGHQLYIPVGFAHGFMTLEPNSEIIYKCSDYYAPDSEGSIVWNDPEIGIKWPLSEKPILSQKDNCAPSLKAFDTPFIYREAQ